MYKIRKNKCFFTLDIAEREMESERMLVLLASGFFENFHGGLLLARPVVTKGNEEKRNQYDMNNDDGDTSRVDVRIAVGHVKNSVEEKLAREKERADRRHGHHHGEEEHFTEDDPDGCIVGAVLLLKKRLHGRRRLNHGMCVASETHKTNE